MTLDSEMLAVSCFASRLGWMGLLTNGGRVERLTFGHPTKAAARQALPSPRLAVAEVIEEQCELVERLQTYAAGGQQNFDDVPVAFFGLSAFQVSVLGQCRRILYGQTCSYAELALQAGHQGAARAVGNCMAINPVPLIVPCHRVVQAGGRPGQYSAPGGTGMKRQLLAMEAKIWPRIA